MTAADLSYGCIASRLRGTFAVPPALMGPPPRLRSARERGVYLRARCQHMGLDFDEWPEEAQQVEMDEQRERIEAMLRTPYVCGGGQYTLWDRVRESWLGR